MVALRNINPLGAVELPLIGRVLDAGEVFDIADDLGAALLEQVGNYELATEPAAPDVPAPAAEPTTTDVPQEGGSA